MNTFYNPYMVQGNYMTELQNMRDRIDNQIQQVQHQQQNMQQPTNLTQNFQLAPINGNNNFKIVNNFEEAKKEIVLIDTYFMLKDNTQMWIKNSRGDIRTFEINEIIPKDEKDLLIEDLQKQLAQLKGGNSNEFNESNGEQLSEQSTTTDDKSIRKTASKNESSNVPIISNGKTTKRKP